MLTCTGFAAQSPTTPLGPITFDRRDVGPEDVEIEILYCGVCHSDLHFARDEWHFTVYPAVPGHEIVGRVTSVGSGVTKFKVGRTRALAALWIRAGSVRRASRTLSNIARRGWSALTAARNR